MRLWLGLLVFGLLWLRFADFLFAGLFFWRSLARRPGLLLPGFGLDLFLIRFCLLVGLPVAWLNLLVLLALLLRLLSADLAWLLSIAGLGLVGI